MLAIVLWTISMIVLMDLREYLAKIYEFNRLGMITVRAAGTALIVFITMITIVPEVRARAMKESSAAAEKHYRGMPIVMLNRDLLGHTFSPVSYGVTHDDLLIVDSDSKTYSLKGMGLENEALMVWGTRSNRFIVTEKRGLLCLDLVR